MSGLNAVKSILKVAGERSAAAKACGSASQCTCANLKRELWINRIAYWQTRASGMSGSWGRAKNEWGVLKDRLAAGPGAWSNAEATGLAFFSAEMFAFFCIGEMAGRGSIVGYNV